DRRILAELKRQDEVSGNLVITLTVLANSLHVANRHADALPRSEEAVKIAADVAALNPSSRDSEYRWLRARVGWADSLLNVDRIEEAIDAYVELEDDLAARLAKDPKRFDLREVLMQSLANHGRVLVPDASRADDAAAVLQRAN